MPHKTALIVEKFAGHKPERREARAGITIQMLLGTDAKTIPVEDFMLYHMADLARNKRLFIVYKESFNSNHAEPVNIRYFSDTYRGYMLITKLDEENRVSTMSDDELLLAEDFFHTYGTQQGNTERHVEKKLEKK